MTDKPDRPVPNFQCPECGSMSVIMTDLKFFGFRVEGLKCLKCGWEKGL